MHSSAKDACIAQSSSFNSSFGWNKAERVKLLMDHRAARAAAQTTNGQTGNNPEFERYESVQYKGTSGGRLFLDNESRMGW